MSDDAKTWKKSLLRELGATVVEHQGDYSLAVASARELASKNDYAYFVDDESSALLMLGYAQAAAELASQLAAENITPSNEEPLTVMLPCGVGGAPVGIALGLKALWGSAVHPVLVEPIDAPCMTLALMTDALTPIQSVGLSGKTAADGLAVGCASPLALAYGKAHIAGCVTLADTALYTHLQQLYRTEHIVIEPSAAAGLAGLAPLLASQIVPAVKNGAVVVWSTGGGLLPAEEFQGYLDAASSC